MSTQGNFSEEIRLHMDFLSAWLFEIHEFSAFPLLCPIQPRTLRCSVE